MAFELRNYDHVDNAPFASAGAAWFDGDILTFRRGSTLCGSAVFTEPDGKPSLMLCLTTAPKRAWIAGDTDAWDTCIIFGDRVGAKAALRVARWLLRGDPSARLVVDGDICLHVGAEHAKLPCWRALARAVPERFPWREQQFSLIGQEVLPPHPNAAAERRHNRVLGVGDHRGFTACDEGR